jgi:HD-like signal output (HDOD) protein
MTDAGTTAAQPLTEQIRMAVVDGKVYLPALPELVTQLRDLLDDESRSGSQAVADLVRNEPAVSATLLRLANSAAFGGLHRIADLSQAVARLGLKQVASVVTAHAHSGHFDSDDPAKRERLHVLWGHAVGTAMAAKRLAATTGGDPEESFLAGLLHDVGRLLVLKGVDYLEDSGEHGTITPVVLDELMDLLHAELGHWILQEWQLPDSVCRVALLHHDQPEPEDDLRMRVQISDAVTRKIGEHADPDPDLDLMELPAVEMMNLGDMELATLMVDLEDEIAEVKGLF